MQRSTRPRPDFLCSDDSESDSSDDEGETKTGWLVLLGLREGCSEQDVRDYLKKHGHDDPEPIRVAVWCDELCGFTIAHVAYEGDKCSVPNRLCHELSGAVFDGMTIKTGVDDGPFGQ